MNFLTPIAKNLPLVFIEDVLTKNLYKQLIDFNHVNYGVGIGYTANQFKEFLELFKTNIDFTVELKTIKIKPEDFKVSLSLESFILHHKNNIIGVFGYCRKTKLMIVNFINSPENEVFNKNLREIELSESFPKVLKDFSSEDFFNYTVCEFLAALYNGQVDDKKIERYRLKEFTGSLFNETEHEQRDINFITFDRTFRKTPELINKYSVSFNEKVATASGYYFNKDQTEFGHFFLDPYSEVTFSPFYKETKKQP